MLLLAAGLAVCISRVKAARAAQAEEPVANTVALQKQNLEKSFSVTGTIISGSSEMLESETTDVKVLEVKVSLGDVVKKGDVLCMLDKTDVEEKLANAVKNKELGRRKAALDLESAINSMKSIAIARNIELERNNKAVADAYNAYEAAQNKIINTYNEWQGALSSEKSKSNAASAGESEYERMIAKVQECKREAEKKQNQYEAAVSALTEEEGKKDASGNNTGNVDGMRKNRDKAKNEWDKAKQALDAAEYELAKCERGKTEKDSLYAEAKSVTSAKEAEYKAAVTERDTAAKNYENAVYTHQDKIRTGEQEVQNQTKSVAAAKLGVSATDYTDDDITIRKYRSMADACTIVAPFDGTVTSVAVKAGGIYKGGEILTIQDTGKMLVSAAVDQYSISDVEKGMKSYIKVNAAGDEALDGVVSFVSPIPKKSVTGKQNSTENAGSSNSNDYEVWISLNKQNKRLRLGMTLKTTIVQSEAQNVFAVPYNCIMEEDGKQYIEVVDNSAGKDEDLAGQAAGRKKVFVKKGLEADYYVEIISDELREGMEVLVPQNESVETVN